jgi:hypothetical protein
MRFINAVTFARHLRTRQLTSSSQHTSLAILVLAQFTLVSRQKATHGQAWQLKSRKPAQTVNAVSSGTPQSAFFTRSARTTPVFPGTQFKST